MTDKFPLRPDTDWYDALRSSHGDAVPTVERMRIRRGLQSLVSDMYVALHDLDLIRHVDIRGIDTRNATYIVVDAHDRAGAFEDDRIAIDFAIERAQAQLSQSCEHCGKAGEIVVKVGLESLLADAEIELGDRFLCTSCAAQFQIAQGDHA